MFFINSTYVTDIKPRFEMQANRTIIMNVQLAGYLPLGFPYQLEIGVGSVSSNKGFG